MSSTPITVVLVTFNSASVLTSCLTAIPSACRDVSYRLVIVDNGSTDHTCDVVAEHAPDAEFVATGRNPGYAAAVNLGTRGAPGAVLVLNPDTELQPGSVGSLMDALDDAQCGIAVPRVLGPDGAIDRSLRREPTLLRAMGEAVLGGTRAGHVSVLGEVVMNSSEYASPHRTDWALGAAMLISRRCLDSTGPWDESFFLYSEETDFCLRARDAGFATQFVPNAEVVHLGGESGTSPHLWTILTLNRVRSYRKRHGPVATASFWAVVTLGEAVRSLGRRPTHRAALAALVHGPGALDAQLARRCPQEAGPPGNLASTKSSYTRT